MTPIFTETNQSCWQDPLRQSPGRAPFSQDWGLVVLSALGRGAGEVGKLCPWSTRPPRREWGAERYSLCGQFASGVPTQGALTLGMVMSPGGGFVPGGRGAPPRHVGRPRGGVFHVLTSEGSQ